VIEQRLLAFEQPIVAARYACTASISSSIFKGSTSAEISRNVFLAGVGILSACNRRSLGVRGGW
jgi:hypothetical protein